MNIDRIDKAILNLLQRDATLSVGQIAGQVAISKTACWRRIQQLDKSGVIRHRVALLDAGQLNLSLTVYIAVRTNQHNDAWAQQFQRVLADIPEVLEVCRTSGDLDYLIKAVVPDMPGYDRLYKKLIKADLSDVSASFVMEQMKSTTELPLDYL
ncbi:Lrp/AsnC family transcriptional regulator [Marinobacterium jannaschii]|uniref:Lrp/AsnC family transcriptional regulator n=1 Tax=Marinobacterium jannaschii TaxID=64970 RepID=UPI0005693619|nr:Lrp/AsnC family transcriptional regulator [Marinobacterium jannaschii]